MRIVIAVSSVFLVLLLVACGGSSTATSTPPPPPSTVTITASTTNATLAEGASQSFSATVSGSSNTAVAWSIQEGSAGGTIDANGKYTAPGAPGTFHIIVTAMADPTKSVVITVTVTAPSNVIVTIFPTSATMFTGSTQAFSEFVSGASNTSITMSIQEGSVGGRFNGGFYISSLTPGTYHIIATSVADPTKSTTATITTVAPPPGSGSFTTQPAPANFAGLGSFAQLADGSVLTAGPVVDRFTFTNAAAVLSLDNSGMLTLTQVGNMINPRFTDTPVLMSDGRVLIAGGATWGGAVTAAEIYDPKTRTFSQTGSTTAGSNGFPEGVLQKDGTVLVFAPPTCCITGNVPGPLTGEFYDPASGTFGNAFSISGSASGPSSAVLKDGRILFVGGFVVPDGVTFQTVATAQIFDPQTRSVAATGSMTTARSGASATTLTDGRVLIVGGAILNVKIPGTPFSTGTLLSGAEIYDPATGTFSTTGSTLEQLAAISTILLPSGKVLVLGSNSITAELYDPATGKFSVAAQMDPAAQTGYGGGYAMFNMPNGTVMLATVSPSLPFTFYHP